MASSPDQSSAPFHQNASTPPGQGLKKFVGILGIPRSGTTLLTAVLSVHSDVVGVFEPWNANKNRVNVEHPLDLGEFLDTFSVEISNKSILVVKETATDYRYIMQMDHLLGSIPASIDRSLVIMLRNPFHVFLSEIQARREWWGAGDVQADVDNFERWASRTISSLGRLAGLAHKYDALLVSYEKLSGNLGGVDLITRALGIKPQASQLEFEKHLDLSKVRGDNRIASSPRQISSSSVDYRSAELLEVVAQLRTSPQFSAVERLQVAFDEMPLFSQATDCPNLLQVMSGN